MDSSLCDYWLVLNKRYLIKNASSFHSFSRTATDTRCWEAFWILQSANLSSICSDRYIWQPPMLTNLVLLVGQSQLCICYGAMSFAPERLFFSFLNIATMAASYVVSVFSWICLGILNKLSVGQVMYKCRKLAMIINNHADANVLSDAELEDKWSGCWSQLSSQVVVVVVGLCCCGIVVWGLW